MTSSEKKSEEQIKGEPNLDQTLRLLESLSEMKMARKTNPLLSKEESQKEERRTQVIDKYVHKLKKDVKAS